MPAEALAGEGKIDINDPWRSDREALQQVQRFNRFLAWLPRFRIRNRLTPRLIQALLWLAQKLGPDRLAPYGLQAENRRVAMQGDSVPVRIIRPRGPARGVVLDIHGGGWVIGNAQMDDTFNARLVDACQVAVVSVDYRLATTATIDEILADCQLAARWLLSDECAEFAGLPVVIQGESAGGHLAVATLLGLKSSPPMLSRICAAVLYYGLYDLTGTASVRAASADTLVLDGPGLVPALRMLTPDMADEERRRPPYSPLYGELSQLPPALMFAGELDPLRDDSLELAERWKHAAEVELQLLPDSPHGFLHFRTAMADQVLTYSHAWIAKQIAAKQQSRDFHSGEEAAPCVG
jgi:acetyl esterase/lipase